MSSNFYFAVVPLENAKIRLVPFQVRNQRTLLLSLHSPHHSQQPELHLDLVFTAFAPHTELFAYLPIEPFTSVSDVAALIDRLVQKDPGATLFVAYDKTRNGRDQAPVVAGLIALIQTDPNNLTTEIAWVMILPDFQRTHVTTNAVGLLLHYCLDAPPASASHPSDPDPISGVVPGIGLRRVQWLSNVNNERSVRAATRLGFRYEGTLRWHRALPVGKGGVSPRTTDPKLELRGRHSAILSLCWDDWEGGVRDKVRALMTR